MPAYRIFRMKDAPRQQFRWAPHVSGETTVRPKDYEEAETVEASSVYSVWEALRKTDRPLRVGDLLVLENGELRVVKYVGFEEARWYTPEPKPAPEPPATQTA